MSHFFLAVHILLLLLLLFLLFCILQLNSVHFGSFLSFFFSYFFFFPQWWKRWSIYKNRRLPIRKFITFLCSVSCSNFVNGFPPTTVYCLMYCRSADRDQNSYWNGHPLSEISPDNGKFPESLFFRNLPIKWSLHDLLVFGCRLWSRHFFGTRYFSTPFPRTHLITL